MLQLGSTQVPLKSVRLKHMLRLFVRACWECSTHRACTGFPAWEPGQGRGWAGAGGSQGRAGAGGSQAGQGLGAALLHRPARGCL